MNPGDVIDARFVLERRIASGGMGHVYRARDLQAGVDVAFKLLHGNASERPVRFQREVDALLALEHPGIVRYVANGATARGTPYLVMEWLEGLTLGERLSAGALDVDDSLAVALGIATALAEVHARGFIHRDLKPSNIFLVGGAVAAVKLIDFGLARLGRAQTDLTAPGMVLGTVGYLAPEQARGDPGVDARADVFALGCVLYRCVTGKRPFMGEDDLSVLLKIIVEEPPRLRELVADAPAALEDLVARMLAKPPSGRPRDAGAVVAALGALTSGGGPPGTLRSRVPEIGTRERRVMSLVLTRGPAGDADPDALRAPVLPDSQSLAFPTPPLETTDRFAATVDRHRGQLVALADGSSLVVFTSDGEAKDLAARAARCALSLRVLTPSAPVVVVSGRAELAGRKLVGELIDRAVALLPPPGAPAVRIDETTAGLLGPGFSASSGWLSGERESLDVPRTLLGKDTVFVGRERELGALEAAYARAVGEPSANVVLVTAAAGMGKSRLVTELLRRLRQRPDAPEIWIGRGDPMSAGSSFALLGQALRRALGLVEGAPLEARRGRLRERVLRREARPDHAARIAEFLGELTGTPFPDAGRPQLRAARRDPVLLGDQMRRAFEDFLRGECAARPLLFVLEDLQWGDLPTVKFVDAALRHLETRPFLVLAIARPEVHTAFPSLWSGRGLEEVHLAALARRAGEKLVRAVLGAAAPDAVVDALLERADGNAFYLEELIRAVADGKGDAAALPETVLAMVQARLEALHVEERRVLRAASIFGQTFREEGVEALLGGAKARGWLRMLTEQEVVAPADDTARGRAPTPVYRFRHALVREAAYAMLTDADRTLGHRLAAEWLGTAGAGDAADVADAGVLAEHFERGAEPARAAGFYRRAAEQAFEGNDLAAALARADRGLACLDDPESVLAGELSLVRAKASRWSGNNAQAEESAARAMRLLPPGGARWCEAAAEVVYLSGKLGHTDRLLACTESLLALPAEADVASVETAAAHAAALARAATTLQLSAGRQALVEVVLDRADEAAAHTQGDPAVAGQVLWARSLRVLAAGDLTTFLALNAASRAALSLAGDLRSECIQSLNAGHGLLQLGAFDEAARVLADAAANADRMGLANARAYAKLNLGPALLGRGRLAEARAVAEETLALFRAQGDLPLEATARTYLALVLAASGEPAAATEALAVAADPRATPASRAYARAILAGVQLAAGDAPAALAGAEAAMSILTSLDGIEEGEAHIRVVYAEALEVNGDRAGARAAITEARDRLLARAEKVADAALRKSFLEAVPENARTLARARAWLG